MSFTENDVKRYYKHTVAALLSRSWEKMDYDLQKNSWESVAKEWVKEMEL
jgi:hypothetical protein